MRKRDRERDAMDVVQGVKQYITRMIKESGAGMKVLLMDKETVSWYMQNIPEIFSFLWTVTDLILWWQFWPPRCL